MSLETSLISPFFSLHRRLVYKENKKAQNKDNVWRNLARESHFPSIETLHTTCIEKKEITRRAVRLIHLRNWNNNRTISIHKLMFSNVICAVCRFLSLFNKENRRRTMWKNPHEYSLNDIILIDLHIYVYSISISRNSIKVAAATSFW